MDEPPFIPTFPSLQSATCVRAKIDGGLTLRRLKELVAVRASSRFAMSANTVYAPHVTNPWKQLRDTTCHHRMSTINFDRHARERTPLAS